MEAQPGSPSWTRHVDVGRRIREVRSISGRWNQLKYCVVPNVTFLWLCMLVAFLLRITFNKEKKERGK